MIENHGVYYTPTEEEIADMEPRIKAFIFPSIPVLDFEKQAFDKAVLYQINHEMAKSEVMKDQTLPDGVQSFKIGDFSMSFENGSFDSRLTKKTICPTAYGILLEAGLMYKGVEGRLFGGAD